MLLKSFSASDIVNLIIWKQFCCTLLAMQRESESASTCVQAKCIINAKPGKNMSESAVSKDKQEELED